METIISQVEVRPVQFGNESKLRAYVSIEIAGKLRIKSLRIIEGQRGLFVAMPQMKRTQNNEVSYIDLIKPIDQQTRKELSNKILNEYERLMQKNAA